MRALILAAVFTACCIPACSLELSDEPYSALVVGQAVNPADPSVWNYSLTNTSSSSNYTIWLLAIEIDEGTKVLNVQSPNGWACDYSVPHFISWMYVTSEVPAGSSQTGFTAEFDGEPSYQNWTVMFNNTENPGESPTEFGSVATATVPEPSSIMALFAGIAAMAGIRKKVNL